MEGRNYFVLELRSVEAQTYLFSAKTPIEYEALAEEVVAVKKGKTGKTLNLLKKEVERRGIRFHTPQKHTGESLDKWVDRLIEKVKV